jgi:hypothetical protein
VLLFLRLVLAAEEEKAVKKTEAKSPHEQQKEPESKQGKRGAQGQEESVVHIEQGGQAGFGTEVTHHKPIVTEKVVHVHVPVPVPYPVEFVKHVPYPVKVPVPVVVHKPFPVPIPKPLHFTVEKKEPYPVTKHVPYPVKVPVPDSYAIPDPKVVPQPVPLLIKQHLDHQENPKPQAYKEGHYVVITGGAVNINIPGTNYEIPVESHDEQYYNIPDTYKAVVPNSHNTLHLSDTTHQHAIPEHLPYMGCTFLEPRRKIAMQDCWAAVT